MRPTRLIAAIAIMVSGAVPAPAQEQTKTLFTEGFEKPDGTGTLPLGWTHFTALRTVSLSTEQVYEGKHSLQLVDEDAKLAVGLRSPHFAVTPGQHCWVSWWYYGSKGNNQSLYLEFWTADGKRPAETLRSWPCRGAEQWTRGVARAKVPPAAATVTVHLNSYSTNVAAGYFDDLELGTGAKSMYDRTPKPPAEVSHPCGLYKPADVDRAKRNAEKHEWAKQVVAGFESAARFWVECPEDKLSYWIPALTPFRVVDCPKCGAGWRFAWEGGGYDQLKCRGCGFTWPDPACTEEKTQTFLDPVGEEQAVPHYEGKPSTVYGAAQTPGYRLSGRLRYHRINTLGSLGAVGKAYAFNGDKRYADTVRRVLLRLAEVYPHYLAHDWNRIYDDYSNLQSGKFSGWKLHDAGVFIQLATAYDLTYNSGVYSDADKVRIEEGCFREFARLMTATSPRGCCVNDGPTAMAAGALTGLMLGDHNALAWAVEPPDGFLGFLEDYFLRNGHWYEASPSYEGMTLGSLYVTPEALRGYSDPPAYQKPDRYDNLDLFTHPLLKKILVASAYERMPDGCLPATNDSTFGATYPRTRAEQNYFWYPTERNLQLMAWAFGGEVGDEGGEYTLFRRDPELDFSNVRPLNPSGASVVRPDVGWAILRSGDSANDADGRRPSAALMLDYGPFGSGHGHPDRLNLSYYDFGKELVTDLGYLSWGHPFHPWLRSTASHNQVIVDGKPQAQAAGELEAFWGQGNVQAVIASAPAVYAGTVETYRRNLVFVDHGAGQRYVVDLFEVRGGKDHQYAFHADGETFRPPPLSYGDAQPSTLGDESTGYTCLKGLKQAPAPTAFVCDWISDDKQSLGTRLHVLGDPNTQLFHGTAPGLRNHSDPFGKRDLHCVYLRRPGPENAFLAVIEAFKGEPAITRVKQLAAESAAGHVCAVEVRLADRVDLVLLAGEQVADGALTLPEYPALRFTGRMAFVSLKQGAPVALWMLRGQSLAFGEVSLTGVPGYKGRIVARNEAAGTITVDADLPEGAAWAGQQLLVGGYSDGAYAMESVRRDGGKTVVRLAGEPVLHFKEGDPFSVVSAVRLTR